MGALELRDNVLKYVNQADERLLEVVKVVMETYWEDEIVAFSVEGIPVKKADYKATLQEAILEIKSGKFISQKDLELESENW
jgi:hypothetical protein